MLGLELFLMLLVGFLIFGVIVVIAKIMQHFDWMTALAIAPMILLLWIVKML